MSAENTTIQFRCVKVGGRLRIRIITEGYNHSANCQFPRKIRKEGGLYSAPVSALSFSEGARHKFFYRVKASQIIILEEGGEDVDLSKVKVFEDEEEECVVCFDNPKDIVFVPCGHYCCCDECYRQISASGSGKCVMCRADIIQVAKREELG